MTSRLVTVSALAVFMLLAQVGAARAEDLCGDATAAAKNWAWCAYLREMREKDKYKVAPAIEEPEEPRVLGPDSAVNRHNRQGPEVGFIVTEPTNLEAWVVACQELAPLVGNCATGPNAVWNYGPGRVVARWPTELKARIDARAPMHEGKLSGDEVILLWMSIGAGGFGAFRWYWRLSKTGAVVRPGHLFVWLGVVPPLALAGIFIVLKVASSFDVRNSFSYLLLYTTLGASWIFLSAYLMEKAGVSFRDDAVERRNPAAAILVGSAVVAHATIYAGANIGDGPGWWAVVAAGLIGSGVWFLSWSVVELCRSVSEEITVERDVPIAIRLAGFALATGLVCARGSAGDWTSLAQTLIEFRSAWPVLPFTAAAIGLESLLKTKPRSTRPGINGSVIIAICYLALAFAAVHTSGPLPNNPIYDHAAVP
jgi:hypothetical protein